MLDSRFDAPLSIRFQVVPVICQTKFNEAHDILCHNKITNSFVFPFARSVFYSNKLFVCSVLFEFKGSNKTMATTQNFILVHFIAVITYGPNTEPFTMWRPLGSLHCGLPQNLFVWPSPTPMGRSTNISFTVIIKPWNYSHIFKSSHVGSQTQHHIIVSGF